MLIYDLTFCIPKNIVETFIRGIIEIIEKEENKHL